MKILYQRLFSIELLIIIFESLLGCLWTLLLFTLFKNAPITDLLFTVSINLTPLFLMLVSIYNINTGLKSDLISIKNKCFVFIPMAISLILSIIIALPFIISD